MKKTLLPFIYTTNQVNAIETNLAFYYHENGEDKKIIFLAKETKAMIIQKLKQAHFLQNEIDCYAPRIKVMLNQFDEASDYPTV